VRVAVTGARGRLGRALLEALARAPERVEVLAWSRPDYDLDEPESAERCVGRHRPAIVVHAAAWTDVDGCARDPARAMARNAEAVARIARACAARGIDLVLISTNEVFDGRRTDGRGYGVVDPPNPINPYGASKLAGEVAALRAYGIPPPWRSARGGAASEPPGAPVSPGASASPAPGASASPPLEPSRSPSRARLAIVRTAWLFGPPGNDFPSKIAAAAKAAAAEGRPLRVVGDEVGSPTYTVDLAAAIVRLMDLKLGRLAPSPGGPIWHLVNAGRASRAEWARATLWLLGLETPIVEIPADEWIRASTPPRWAVLDPAAVPPGVVMRPWEAALAEYLGGGSAEAG
jgi:dTDP-4-dehydrorhamnose reductase